MRIDHIKDSIYTAEDFKALRSKRWDEYEYFDLFSISEYVSGLLAGGVLIALPIVFYSSILDLLRIFFLGVGLWVVVFFAGFIVAVLLLVEDARL